MLKIICVLVFAAGAYEFIQNMSGLSTRDPRAISILVICSAGNTLALFGLFYAPDRRVQKRKAQVIARQAAVKVQQRQSAADELSNM